MAIKKQEFYEGAALHVLARSGVLKGVQYRAPFFEIDDQLRIYLKYSTRVRSPWGFTFTATEQELLGGSHSARGTLIGLICGSDGVAAIDAEDFRIIVRPRKSAIHIACHRLHGEHYEVRGPDGTLAKKIPPSAWQRILER